MLNLSPNALGIVCLNQCRITHADVALNLSLDALGKEPGRKYHIQNTYLTREEKVLGLEGQRGEGVGGGLQI